jgi:hypothetical protein
LPLPSLLLVAAAACSGCSSSSGNGSGGASACVYPAGPYGTNVGDVVDPSLTWQGFVDDSGSATTIRVRDYYDCDGSRGVRALLLDESATWCTDCAKQSSTVAPLVTGKWKDEGVTLVVLMAQDQNDDAATLDTALSWRNEYALTRGAVCADPGWTMKLWGGASASGNAFPTDVLVDPRSMKIVALQPNDLEGTVDNLALSNQ